MLIIEHIAISKSFGRLNNYVINPSQELVAIGFTNVFGPFLGAYPATGSFSRTAIKAKAGVRTPLAGLWTALLVVLALYALTKVFFYIPMASLSGLIIHAVGDLITPPATVYQFWQVSPIEVVLFFAGVIIMVFTDIETGVYFVVAASAALLLLRIAKAHGSFRGKVEVYQVSGDTSADGADGAAAAPASTKREAYLALDRRDGSNTSVAVRNPYPGVFVYRFSEGFNYANTAHYMDELVAYIQAHTRPTTLDRFEKIGVSYIPPLSRCLPTISPTPRVIEWGPRPIPFCIFETDWLHRTVPGMTRAPAAARWRMPWTTGPCSARLSSTSAP